MLIDALAKRYAAAPNADRAPLDRAYAEAMRGVASKYPADPDVQTFFADAVMNTMPWDYWLKDGSPKPDTAVILAAVDAAIAKVPDHAGAHHYVIHLMEASNDPDRAVASADKLGALMPAAGHIVHMPAHIYIRVGRYADAAEANVRAIEADEDYLAQCQAQGLYPISYYPHNLHFLWAAATFEGRSAVAVEAARKVAEKTPHHHAGALAWTADFPVTPLLAYTRFGKWREILTEPSPPANQPYATGIWHYARATAFVATDKLDRAEDELAALAAIMNHEAFKTTLKDLPLLPNLQIASRLAAGMLAARQGRLAAAITSVREAVALEDAFPYSEPPLWHLPPRQVLGAILLQDRRPAEAEQVYREDLARFRENGWSLYGLMQAVTALGRTAEAAEIRARFDKAWSRADVTLSSSYEVWDRASRPKTIALPTGVTLEYVERGDRAGTPIVFLHGLTDSWRSFELMLPELPPSVRALVISQRGHGNSSRPDAGYTFKHFADDVRAFLDAMDIPSAVIVGHSMGGLVAQRFAIDHPSRTIGIVILGSSPAMGQNDVVRALVQAVSVMNDPIDPKFVREFQEGTIARPVPPGLVDMAVAESLKVPARVWRAAFEETLEADFTARLGRISAPTLIIWGEKDSVVTKAEVENLHRGIPQSRLIVYKDAGHASHWEAPAQVADDLMAFVRLTASASRSSPGRSN